MQVRKANGKNGVDFPDTLLLVLAVNWLCLSLERFCRLCDVIIQGMCKVCDVPEVKFLCACADVFLLCVCVITKYLFKFVVFFYELEPQKS